VLNERRGAAGRIGERSSFDPVGCRVWLLFGGILAILQTGCLVDSPSRTPLGLEPDQLLMAGDTACDVGPCQSLTSGQYDKILDSFQYIDYHGGMECAMVMEEMTGALYAGEIGVDQFTENYGNHHPAHQPWHYLAMTYMLETQNAHFVAQHFTLHEGWHHVFGSPEPPQWFYGQCLLPPPQQ
jgi:hypothetical protein